MIKLWSPNRKNSSTMFSQYVLHRYCNLFEKGFLLYLFGSSAQMDMHIRVQSAFRRQVDSLTCWCMFEVRCIRTLWCLNYIEKIKNNVGSIGALPYAPCCLFDVATVRSNVWPQIALRLSLPDAAECFGCDGCCSSQHFKGAWALMWVHVTITGGCGRAARPS